MKHIISALCICIFIFFGSCKKETQNNSSSIVGTWELRQASGQITINYPSGNGNILKFTATNYESDTNGVLQKSGQYLIVADPTVEQNVCLVYPPGQFTNRIIYDNDTISHKQFIQISNNKLSIVSGCYSYDGGSTREYEKIESNPQ